VAGKGRYDWTTVVFLGPPAVLLLIFLVYPTLYTIALSFNRGRRGEFTEWVGFDNFASLFKDKSFLNLSTFRRPGRSGTTCCGACSTRRSSSSSASWSRSWRRGPV